MTPTTMTPAMPPFLARVLLVDAALSGLTALALLADAEPLSAWLGLPAGALRMLGALLVPWAALLAWLGTRRVAHRVAVGAVVALNFLWVLDCALGAFGLFGAPQGPGVAVFAVQAIGTFVIAELEWMGLRRAAPARGVAGLPA
ncbi:MAG: hypothetical protein U1F53_13385 [Burkholderiaceae bacterium]